MDFGLSAAQLSTQHASVVKVDSTISSVPERVSSYPHVLKIGSIKKLIKEPPKNPELVPNLSTGTPG
ncbi:hypothetical protein Ocin01_01921 [Orchesella cincta]|uniref:Uncharacterized protein n=1 Tax=Orchesella cincta TaxID=48709 RepID=A0A1D2NII9_ORCCI|nr:hypothetical protein Ocin01_01921 [Orchesella cincta]